MAQARQGLKAHESDARFQGEREEMLNERDLNKIDDDVEAEATLIEWQADEHIHKPKGTSWYIGAVVVAVVLAGVFWFLGNYFGIAVVVVGMILLFFVFSRGSTRQRYRLMVDGVAINNRLYHYKYLDAFNIIYEPGDVKVLLIKSKKTLVPLLALELGSVNPIEVRNVLLEFLREDLEIEEPLADVLARRLGF